MDDNTKLNSSLFPYSSSSCTTIPPASINNLSLPSPSAILDSGCTGHYFPPGFPLSNVQPNHHSLQVKLPDSSYIQSTHTANVPIPTLPPSATQAHVFPHLHSALMSVGKICDADCSVTFTSRQVTIVNSQDDTIATGSRDLSTGLWNLPLPLPSLPSQPMINGIIKRDTPISDLCEFLHSALFSPTLSTLEQALKNGFLNSFPGLTLKTIRKYLPLSEATCKGHLNQEKMGTMSSKASPSGPFKFKPPSVNPHIDVKTDNTFERTMNFMVDIFEPPTGKTYSDQTGKFPCISSRGYKYIFVLYDYDSNHIFAEPLKSRDTKEIIQAFTKIHDFLKSRGLKPLFHTLDNECSILFQQALTDNQVNFQITPPYMHRRNAAERAIRTFKEHFLAGLASMDKKISNAPMG